MTHESPPLQSVLELLEKEKTNLTGEALKQLLDKVADVRLHADFKDFEEYRERYKALLRELSIPLRAYKLTAEKYLSLKPENAWKLLEKQHQLLKDAKTKPKKGKIKYQHPGDPDTFWTGIGPQPRWFKDYLEAGGTKEELEEAAKLTEKQFEE